MAQSWHWLLVCLVVLVAISAFFSGSETGLMAVNRYRLQHRVRQGQRDAVGLSKLLANPDKILSLILIGNTFANIAASAVATVLAGQYWGEMGVLAASVILTLVVLIFAEIIPKTIAATQADGVAYRVVAPMRVLMRLLHPLVWLTNRLATWVMKAVGISIKQGLSDPLSPDELRGLILGGGQPLSATRRNMLVGVMDLDSMSVDDVMILKRDIQGIDLEQRWDAILSHIKTAEDAVLYCYRRFAHKPAGMLQLRHVLDLSLRGALNRRSLERSLTEPRYIPEGVSLQQQLQHFLAHGYDRGLVVNEFGGVVGLLCVDDIVEEIVGEYATEDDAPDRFIAKQTDGSVLVDARIHVRDLNRAMDWALPIDGPNTLGGLVVEHLQVIPSAHVGLRIGGYPMDVEALRRNRVAKLRIYPDLWQSTLSDAIDE